MATDAVPAAVPGPGDRPDATTPSSPATGLLASLVAPVTPARPAFDLTPTAGANGAPDAAVTGASSAAYHGADDAPKDGTNTTAGGRKEKGVIRAWLLAGAARWARGGGTQNKRLDVKKARAQAQQVKEARQVTVNRSGGLLGKTSGASGAGGKSLGGKGKSDGAGKGPKNSNGSEHGPAGRSNGSAHGPDKRSGGSSGSGAGGGSGRGSAGGRGSGAGGPSGGKGGGSETGSTGHHNAGSSKDASKADAKKRSESSGADTGSSKESGTRKKGADTKSETTTTCGDASGIDLTKSKRNNKDNGKANASGSQGRTNSGSSGASKDSPDAAPSGKSDTAGAKQQKADPEKGNANEDTKTGRTPGKDAKQAPAKDDKTTPATDPTTTNAKVEADLDEGQPQTGKPTGKPFSIKQSRETGYRDGTRAAKTVAHVRAYRDGVRDGYGDTTQIADRETARLNKAHEARKKARLDKEQQVNGTASSADYHGSQPIAVTGINGSHVLLGDGAAKPSLRRGEVRRLKDFEARLVEKSASMAKIAEVTKGLKAHADGQARKATQLLEEAKAVKGGEKLVGSLTKLAEAATVQASKAEEIHKRAVRAAEACRVVLANVETRYGGIYQAVVDSDENAPAEMSFYRDHGVVPSHA